MSTLFNQIATRMICRAVTKNAGSDAIRGKLIYADCLSVVVQIQDSAFHFLTQQEWKNPKEKMLYKNVFIVRNSRKFLKYNLMEGQNFYFKIVDEIPTHKPCSNCSVCKNQPYARLSIEVTKTVEHKQIVN